MKLTEGKDYVKFAGETEDRAALDDVDRFSIVLERVVAADIEEEAGVRADQWLKTWTSGTSINDLDTRAPSPGSSPGRDWVEDEEQRGDAFMVQ